MPAPKDWFLTVESTPPFSKVIDGGVVLLEVDLGIVPAGGESFV
jgi:hypothetical protein